MKRIHVIICSLFMIAAFSGTSMATDSKVPQLKTKKPATAPIVPHHNTDGDPKVVGDNSTAGESEEQKKETNDSKKGKKVEKKEEQQKADEKK